jgi:hypothetical protein
MNTDTMRIQYSVTLKNNVVQQISHYKLEVDVIRSGKKFHLQDQYTSEVLADNIELNEAFALAARHRQAHPLF